MRKDLFGRSLAFRLAAKIYAALVEPKYFSLPVTQESFTVRGSLNLSHGMVETSAQAHCRFLIPPNWFEIPPTVNCQEKWIRKDIDWHVYSDHSVCWVLDEEWQDYLRYCLKEYSWEDAEKIAVTWCLNSCSDLLYKHMIAYELGITQWPGHKWEYWSHGRRGKQEYSRRPITQVQKYGR